MSFGDAIQALKFGRKIARSHWGGYWELSDNDEFTDQVIVAHCKDGRICPATPYQEDILAEDWKIL